MKYYCTAKHCVWRFKENGRYACMFPGDICPKGKCISKEEAEKQEKEDEP